MSCVANWTPSAQESFMAALACSELSLGLRSHAVIFAHSDRIHVPWLEDDSSPEMFKPSPQTQHPDCRMIRSCCES
jgi:hypothetical protein